MNHRNPVNMPAMTVTMKVKATNHRIRVNMPALTVTVKMKIQKRHRKVYEWVMKLPLNVVNATSNAAVVEGFILT